MATQIDSLPISSSGSDPTTVDNWTTFNLDWLYDPERFDHLPIDQQLLLYKKRDLRKAKIFKLASTIWGTTHVRKRRFIAASGNALPSLTPNKSTSDYTNQVTDGDGEKPLDPEAEYAQWVKERRKLREGLENLSVNELWLASKHGRTPMEERVLQLLRQKRKLKELAGKEDVKEEKYLQAVLPQKPINIKRPSPEALHILEKFLRERQIRLIDLFRSTDKNKDGKISKDDFREVIKDSGIPLEDGLLDDLIMSLNYDEDGRVDFKQLVKSMEFWLAEKKDVKRKILAQDAEQEELNPELEGFEFPENLCNTSSLNMSKRTTAKANESKTSTGQIKNNRLEPVIEEKHSSGHVVQNNSASTSKAGSRSTSLKSLTPPTIDRRPEQMVLSSEEAMVDLRKRDKVALATFKNHGKKSPNGVPKSGNGDLIEIRAGKKTMIHTGDALVDSHMAPSTMSGEVGDKIDNFRQDCYREYLAVCQLCKERGVILTDAFLKKALLFPADKAHEGIISSLKKTTPTTSLIHSSALTFDRKGSYRQIDDDGDDNDAGSGQSASRHRTTTHRSRSRSRSRGTKPIKQSKPKKKKIKAPSVIQTQVLQQQQTQFPRDTWSSGEDSGNDDDDALGQHKSVQQKTLDDGEIGEDDMLSFYHKPRRDDVGLDAYTRSIFLTPRGNKPTSMRSSFLSRDRINTNRVVDCWMSFEEYRDLVRSMSRRYMTLTTKSNPNANWPGRTLDKIRLCLDRAEPKSTVLFQPTRQNAKRSNPTYNNNLRTWPVSNDGYVQYGNIDSYRLKYI